MGVALNALGLSPQWRTKSARRSASSSFVVRPPFFLFLACFLCGCVGRGCHLSCVCLGLFCVFRSTDSVDAFLLCSLPKGWCSCRACSCAVSMSWRKFMGRSLDDVRQSRPRNAPVRRRTAPAAEGAWPVSPTTHVMCEGNVLCTHK